MVESFSSYILANYPVLGMFSIITGLLLYMAIGFTTKFNTIDHRLSNLEDNTKDLPLMRVALINIETYLKTKDKHFQSHFLRSNSPTVVSEAGMRLLEQCGAKKYLEQNFREIEQYDAESHEIVSAYDLDNYAFDTMKEMSQDKGYALSFVEIKDFIYNNPQFENEWLTFDSVLQIMSVYYRQMFLEKNPGFFKMG